MPVFEYHCAACNSTKESFVHHWDTPVPCPTCGGPTDKLFSRFAAPYSGSMHKYMDPKREGAEMDGFWAYKKRSSLSGQPEPVFISDMQQLREFNKAEGLAAPGEVPTNATISADGKKIESRGMPGQWAEGMPGLPARLREIIAKPAEEFSAPAATVTPCMPIDYGIRAEVVSTPPVEMAEG